MATFDSTIGRMHNSTSPSREFVSSSRITSDIDLTADGKVTGFVRVPHSVHRSAYGWIPIPIVRIKNGDGPSVLMQAGNHGDEWEGQIALGNLIRTIEPSNVRGRLVILPSANFPAARAGRRTSPIDEGNLNRSFPGDADGTITQQIANWIECSLLPGFDYSFDFHSGGSSLMYLPSAMVARQHDAVNMDKVLGLVRAFGAPLSLLTSSFPGAGRTFTAASDRQGVVNMAAEIGGGGFVTPHSVALAEAGMRRVLAHIGVLRGPPPASSPTRLAEVGGDEYYVYATDAGLFEPLTDLGEEVRAGQPAGRIHFYHTPWREPELVRFRHDGFVVCKRVPALCERGDCLFHLATIVTP
jgi:predicted deacylase